MFRNACSCKMLAGCSTVYIQLFCVLHLRQNDSYYLKTALKSFLP